MSKFSLHCWMKAFNFGWSSPQYSIRALAQRFEHLIAGLSLASESDCWQQRRFCWTTTCKSTIYCWIDFNSWTLMVTTGTRARILGVSFSRVLSALFALSSAELLSLTLLRGEKLWLGRRVFRVCQVVVAILIILQRFIGLNEVLILWQSQIMPTVR